MVIQFYTSQTEHDIFTFCILQIERYGEMSKKFFLTIHEENLYMNNKILFLFTLPQSVQLLFEMIKEYRISKNNEHIDKNVLF